MEREEELGVLGPIVTQATEPMSPEEQALDTKLLAIEECRARPVTEEQKRSRMQQRIIENSISQSPHRHYFVRNPGL